MGVRVWGGPHRCICPEQRRAPEKLKEPDSHPGSETDLGEKPVHVYQRRPTRKTALTSPGSPGTADPASAQGGEGSLLFLRVCDRLHQEMGPVDPWTQLPSHSTTSEMGAGGGEASRPFRGLDCAD